jgi:hypothetical protein
MSEFDYPADLSPFPKASARFLTHAHELGWSLRWSGAARHSMAVATSPTREKSINVPTTNINDNRMRSWTNALGRYTDPEVLADYLDKVGVTSKRLPPGIGTDPLVALHPRPSKTAIPRPPKQTALEAAMTAAHEKAEEVSHGVTIDREADAKQVRMHDPDLTVVSEKPWVARRSGQQGGKGTMYESPFVIERLWSDGTVDYRCPHCDFTSDKPRSVSSHGAGRADHPKGPQSKAFPVTNYEASGIQHPNRSAVSRLTSDLLHALDGMENWQHLSREELARRVAEVIIEARPDRAPAEPLTPDQIIERVRMLVDGGRYHDMHKQVEAAGQALRDATAAMEEVTARAEAAEHRVQQLQEERRALADMLREERES